MAVQATGSTPQASAAADTSIMRAAAPACRMGSQAVRTELEPPVTWIPEPGKA
ncbi:hypothetical protein D3C87_1434520 [compost metagenome]